MRFSTVSLMEKAEVNRPVLIFLFDSSASQYLTLAQKKCIWCFLGGVSQLIIITETEFLMSVGTQLLLKTVQVSHVNIHQCLSLKYLSSLKSWLVKGKKKKLRITCSLIPWYTLPASISSGDIANRHNVDQGKREKRTENAVWQSYLLFPLSRSLHHYLYL